MGKDNSKCCKTKPIKLKSSTSSSEISTAKKRKRSASRLRVVEPDGDLSIIASPVIETPEATNVNVARNSVSKMQRKNCIPKRTTKLTDEVICTPDISELNCQDESEDKTSCEKPELNGFNDIQYSVTNKLSVSHPSSPPAILPIQSSFPSKVEPYFAEGVEEKLKSNQINICTSKSVHHIINGFKVDLGKASKQNTYCLPNGKIIKVIKQNTVYNIKYVIDERPQQELARIAHLSQQINQNQQQDFKNQLNSQPSQKKTRYAIPPPKSLPNPNILNANTAVVKPPNSIQLKPQLTKLPALVPKTNHHPMFQKIPDTKNASSLQLQESSPKPFSQIQTRMQRYFPRMPTINMINPSAQTQEQAMVIIKANDTVQAALAQPKNIIEMRTAIREPAVVLENENVTIQTALEQSRNKIRLGLDICDQIKAKFNCLAKSHSYRNSESRAGILDLNLHLSYLFAHAIGRFESLQDLCNEDLKLFGEEKSESIDDEVQLVESETEIIEIISDDEEEIESISNNIKTIKAEPKVVDDHANPQSIIFHNFLSAETNEPTTMGNLTYKTATNLLASAGSENQELVIGDVPCEIASAAVTDTQSGLENILLIDDDDDECEVINIEVEDDVVDNTTAENTNNNKTLCNCEVFDEGIVVSTEDENLRNKVDNLVPVNNSSENHTETLNEIEKESISTFGNWKRGLKDGVIINQDEDEYRKVNTELCDAISPISDWNERETNTDDEDFLELVGAVLGANDKDDLMWENDI